MTFMQIGQTAAADESEACMARCKMPLLLMVEPPALLLPLWFGTSCVTFTPTSRNVAGISLCSSLTATGANSAAHEVADISVMLCCLTVKSLRFTFKIICLAHTLSLVKSSARLSHKRSTREARTFTSLQSPSVPGIKHHTQPMIRLIGKQRTFLRIRFAAARGAGKRRQRVGSISVPDAARDEKRRRCRRKQRVNFRASAVHVCHGAAAQCFPENLFENTADAGHASRGHVLDETLGVLEGGWDDGNAVGFVHVAASISYQALFSVARVCGLSAGTSPAHFGD